MTVKRKKPSTDFGTPFSVLLFEDDAKALAETARRTGITKSQLIRRAVNLAIKSKAFKDLALVS